MQFLVAWINCTKSTFVPPLATVLFTFLNKIEPGNTNRRWLWVAQPTYTKRMLYSLLKETVTWVDQKRTCQKAVQGFKPLLQFVTSKSNTYSIILHRSGLSPGIIYLRRSEKKSYPCTTGRNFTVLQYLSQEIGETKNYWTFCCSWAHWYLKPLHMKEDFYYFLCASRFTEIHAHTVRCFQIYW